MKILSHLRKFMAAPASHILLSRRSFAAARITGQHRQHNRSYSAANSRQPSHQQFFVFSAIAAGSAAISSTYFLYQWWSKFVNPKKRSWNQTAQFLECA